MALPFSAWPHRPRRQPPCEPCAGSHGVTHPSVAGQAGGLPFSLVGSTRLAGQPALRHLVPGLRGGHRCEARQQDPGVRSSARQGRGGLLRPLQRQRRGDRLDRRGLGAGGRGRPCRRRALRGPCRLEARPRRPQGPCGAGLPQVGRGRAGVRRLRPRPRGVPPGPGRLVAGHAEPPPRAGAAGGAGPEDGHQDLGHGRDPREGGVPGREGRLLHVWLPGSACRWLQVQGRRRASLQGRPEAWQGASERGRASGLLFPVSLFGGIEDVCSGEGAGDRRLVD
mmetsp:Transcript_104915/g.338317  ORF Transcript_104915/g.338317 Transcript_104915/m.338317 type:complete len:281 (-) Transcript_104915:271-1113(-)